MASTVFPAPSSATASTAFATTCAVATTIYENESNFSTGVYTVSVSPAASGEARLTFASDTAIITTITTASSVATFTLSTAATKVFINTSNGASANLVVTVTRAADSLTPDDIGNGTLDTINTTGTYNQTGVLGVLVLGGGAAGRACATNSQNTKGADGGRAGFISGGMVITNSATTVTVGAGGIADRGNNTAPTNSSFGNLITTNAVDNAFPNGNGGGGGYDANAEAGNTSAVFQSFNGNSTTGGGAGANRGNNGTTRAGGGSGIGTGGSSQSSNATQGGAGTGKASGGAGGKGGYNQSGQTGGDGAPGVVYVMRGF